MNREFLTFIVAAAFLSLGTGCERTTAPALSFSAKNVNEIRRQMEKSEKGSAGSEAAVAAEPTGWSTLKGRFVLNGTAPPRSPLRVDKDVEVCGAGGQLTSEAVVIGPDNGIQNVLVYVTSPIQLDNPKWVHPSYEETKTTEVPFDQKNCRFLSHVFAMRATQQLKILNSDPVGHNTNLNSTRGTVGANVSVQGHSSYMHDPKKPSPLPFPVSCSIHPWMTAWMMVLDHPYFAVTKEDGSFEIKNVPAGVPLEFRVWQEKAGYLQTVSVDGKAEKWNRGKFVKTFTPDSPLELNVAVDAAIFNK